ncbi:MAG: methyltransferase domain-containing protein [Pseudomonadales bacterium]
MQPSCVACGSSRTFDLVDIDKLPVLCNELHGSRDRALNASSGRMELRFCESCGHYFNSAFDPALMYYSTDYETSLYASGVFRSYADDLVDRLISTYALQDKTILEIGCGRGEFLKHLCRKGGNRGIGFDTSTPVEGIDPDCPGVNFVRDYFSADYDELQTDFVVCQQVLEHLESPRTFLEELSANTTIRGSETVLYFEVPNGLYTTEHLGIWDLIYEHVSYFTPESFQRLFVGSGFEIINAGVSFGDQYLFVEARCAPSSITPAVIDRREVEIAERFPEGFWSKLLKYKERFDTETSKSTMYVWGAGSKGITFCNLIDPEGHVGGLIDRNIAKHGRFIASTGVQIHALADLNPADISTVVTMNPLYTGEVRSDLADCAVEAQVLPA